MSHLSDPPIIISIRSSVIFFLERSLYFLFSKFPKDFRGAGTLTQSIVLADKSEPIQISGSVQWMKERKRYFIGGIKVASAQDEDKLAELVRLTLGIKEGERVSDEA